VKPRLWSAQPELLPAIPVVSNYTFETLLVGFLLLLAGNMFKGF
jgi:hypothetical protein